jgi:hypothetical protein
MEVGMRSDSYTKFVLTVIAACLVWLALGGPAILTVAHAQRSSGHDRVVISGWVDEAGKEHALSDPGRSNIPGVPVAVVWGNR